jgi:hypothetical protein
VPSEKRACLLRRLALSAAATRVALVAVDAVVHIPIHSIVLEVSGIVAAVTGRALEYRIVVRIRMACRANTVCVAMVD